MPGDPARMAGRCHRERWRDGSITSRGTGRDIRKLQHPYSATSPQPQATADQTPPHDTLSAPSGAWTIAPPFSWPAPGALESRASPGDAESPLAATYRHREPERSARGVRGPSAIPGSGERCLVYLAIWRTT